MLLDLDQHSSGSRVTGRGHRVWIPYRGTGKVLREGVSVWWLGAPGDEELGGNRASSNSNLFCVLFNKFHICALMNWPEKRLLSEYLPFWH